MKKLNKLFLAAGSVAAVAAPVAAVVSCGTNEKDLHPEVVLVTDGGSIADKSFNEQAADALKEIKGVTKVTPSMYVQPAAGDAATITKAYASAISHGAKTILAAGYAHKDPLTAYAPQNKNTNFILVDEEVVQPNVASIQFDTKEPAFIAGYLAAKALFEDKANTEKVVGMWGGGDSAGVTDYMTGFIGGIEEYNKLITDAASKIKFAPISGSTGAELQKDYTNSGFDAGNAKAKAKADALVAAQADMILSVAGGQTADAIAAIKNNSWAIKNHTQLIGVDTDQSLKYRGVDFFTSITKNVSEAFQKVYSVVSGQTQATADIKGVGETTHGNVGNGLTGIVWHGDAITQDLKDKAKAFAADNTKTWAAEFNYMSQNFK